VAEMSTRLRLWRPPLTKSTHAGYTVNDTVSLNVSDWVGFLCGRKATITDIVKFGDGYQYWIEVEVLNLDAEMQNRIIEYNTKRRTASNNIRPLPLDYTRLMCKFEEVSHVSASKVAATSISAAFANARGGVPPPSTSAPDVLKRKATDPPEDAGGKRVDK